MGPENPSVGQELEREQLSEDEVANHLVDLKHAIAQSPQTRMRFAMAKEKFIEELPDYPPEVKSRCRLWYILNDSTMELERTPDFDLPEGEIQKFIRNELGPLANG